MKVLSLFDWISCGYEALLEAWIPIDKYYASEIDKYAIKVATTNHQDIEEIWDVCNVHYNNWYLSIYEIKEWWWSTTTNIDAWKIDLLIGWSPCTWFSLAWKQLNFNDPQSKLFFEYLRILKEVKPKYFLLENVKMKKEYQDKITELLWWIEPILIDSALLTAQRRKRNYWVWELQEDWTYKKVEIPQPEDKGILLKDILLDYVEPKYDVSEKHTIAMKNARSCWELNLPKPDEKCWTIIAWYYKTPQDGPYILKDYYLTDKQVDMIANWKWYERPLERVKGAEDKMDTLTTHCGKMSNGIKLVSVPCATQLWNWYWFSNAYWSDKAYTLRACQPNGVIESIEPPKIRKLHPIECERLQWLRDWYTECYKEVLWKKAISKVLSKKIKWLNVVLNDVTDTQIGSECVLCIEEDLSNIEIQTPDQNLIESSKNVYIVIQKLVKNENEQDECVVDTIKTSWELETHYIQTKLKCYQKNSIIDIIEVQIEDTSIGWLWKITFEGSWIAKKLYIISTLIKRIILLKIYTYVEIELNIMLYINNWKISESNCLKSELLLSKIEITNSISATQRYKQLWNWWTVPVIAHIFKHLIKQNG